ncbi:hypothetical protein GGR27_004038 [Lewinella antarctica]|uniref:Uncharacterized protein n=1 Tax=Neolewinella antarctica TaxID=442734 RepID=A0ABX0XI61_9BACT|nr:hypothetical protein [Neolewinella antarctica]
MDDIKIYLEKYIASIRPPIEIRSKFDLAYRIDKQSIYIDEIRPRDFESLSDYNAVPNIKMTYVKSRSI